MSSRSVAFLAVVFSLAMAGCAQTEGETCEVDTDCESGLTCCGAGTTSVGVCQRETCPAPATDAGTAEDGGGTDAEVADGGTDAGTNDAETDTGDTDAGADGGAEADAGSDAGT